MRILNLTQRLAGTAHPVSLRRKLFWLHHILFGLIALSLMGVMASFSQELTRSSSSDQAALAVEVFRTNPNMLRSSRLQAGFRFFEGTAEGLEVPAEALRWFDTHPGEVWQGSEGTLVVYVRRSSEPGLWQMVIYDRMSTTRIVRKLQIHTGIVLGVIYMFAVLVMDGWILPQFVYQPIRRLLEADKALQQGNRAEELIDESQISADEFGQIMVSRNETVRQLRRREDDLTSSFKQLQEITADVKRKNQMLETARQNLADQDRLLSLGLLSAGIAHEMNTPLAVLHGTLEKLLESVSETVLHTRLQRALRVTTRLQTLSESLTDFARARTTEKTMVPVKKLVDEAWTMLQVDSRTAGVHFECEVSETDEVFGNADRLLQVWVNLFNNALQAMEFQGTLIFRSMGRTLGDSQLITLQVLDTGPGISPELVPYIFEPFVTSRLDSKGTGLGLAVAQGIVQEHGGTITATNRESGGACFEITLPTTASA